MKNIFDDFYTQQQQPEPQPPQQPTKKAASRSFIVALCAITIVICLFGAFALGYYGDDLFHQTVKNNVINDITNNNVIIQGDKNGTSAEAVVAKIEDSVVVIKVYSFTKSTNAIYGTTYTQDSGISVGSGVITKQADAVASIVTCEHVIDDYVHNPVNSNKLFVLEVELKNGTKYTSSKLTKNLLGGYNLDNPVGPVSVAFPNMSNTTEKTASTNNDFAVLKLETKELLTTAKIQKTFIKGNDIVIIGNPLGEFPWSVSKGIVSGLNRSIKIQIADSVINLNNLIQTDATINKGNSGGGMFNYNGELIGIVNAKSIDANQGVEGVGFAIPLQNMFDACARFGDYVELAETPPQP